MIESSVTQGKFQTKSGALPYHLSHFEVAGRGEKFFLLLALHGRGGNGGEYLKIWKAEADRRRIMILAPTEVPRERTEYKKFVQQFYDLVESIAREYPVDRKRIYVAGVSSGALTARWLAVERPALWKGVILVASPSHERWTSEVKPKNFPPVLFVHGAKDEQFPLQEIIEHVKILKGKGVVVDLLEYPEAGHEQRPEWTSEIFNWVEKKTRDYS